MEPERVIVGMEEAWQCILRVMVSMEEAWQ